MEIQTRDNIAKWQNLTNEVTEQWIKDYFELTEEDCEFGLDYDWINDEVGTIFQFADYFFNFNDILTCYKLNITKEQLFSWYDFCLEKQFVNISLAKYILSPQERKEQEEKHLLELKERVILAEETFRTTLEEHGINRNI